MSTITWSRPKIDNDVLAQAQRDPSYIAMIDRRNRLLEIQSQLESKYDRSQSARDSINKVKGDVYFINGEAQNILRELCAKLTAAKTTVVATVVKADIDAAVKKHPKYIAAVTIESQIRKLVVQPAEEEWRIQQNLHGMSSTKTKAAESVMDEASNALRQAQSRTLVVYERIRSELTTTK